MLNDYLNDVYLRLSLLAKRSIVATIGLNLTLDNKKLRCELLKPFERIKEAADIMKEDAKKIIPKKRTVIEGQSYYFNPQNPFWGD